MADLEGGKGRGVGKDRDEKAESAAPAPAKSPSQLKLVIFGAVALFVALVGAQVAAPLINAVIAASGSHAEDAEDEELLAEAEEEDIFEERAIEQEPADDRPLAPAIYTALDPPFVVSFDEEDGARYLQLTLQAMARNDKTIAAVKQHAPAIRNSVLFLLSGYELDVLATQAGKEQLRQALLGATNEILAKNRVEPGVEELFFTSLVIQ